MHILAAGDAKLYGGTVTIFGIVDQYGNVTY